MFAETGDVNTMVHQWAYEDAADRARRRAAMMADPEWQVYLKKLNESGLLIEPEDVDHDAGEVLRRSSGEFLVRGTIHVMPGLVPGIHAFLSPSNTARRGWPGQARP